MPGSPWVSSRSGSRRSSDCCASSTRSPTAGGSDTMMPSDAETAARARQLELRSLLSRKYVFLDRKWDIVFWLTAAFVVGAAADITRLLFAGDWDFWVDWKDRQWWPIVTPVAMIIIPSAIQYILWLVWRLPIGATYTAVCLFLASWIGRVYQWQD